MRRSGARFAIVFVFFSAGLLFLAPGDLLFQAGCDPLIVVLAAYFVTERFGGRRQSEPGACSSAS